MTVQLARKSLLIVLFIPATAFAQTRWRNVDSLFEPLPKSVHVYCTNDSLEGKPNIAYYFEADLKDKSLEFTTDTGSRRRLTPSLFYKKNNYPLLVVNSTFFEFIHNSNLNVVIKDGKLLAYNASIAGRGKDTLTYHHPFVSSIGISKKRKADVAWTFTDSTKSYAYASQWPYNPIKTSNETLSLDSVRHYISLLNPVSTRLSKWKMRTAVGGGPVLLQNGEIKITNNEELKFSGNAINDKHPRTAMGYTKDNKLIVLVIQGRFEGVAEGATLVQEAVLLKDIGCWEALNLDGGGSSCMLVNGKETIKPSDKEGQRGVPAVFIVKESK